MSHSPTMCTLWVDYLQCMHSSHEQSIRVMLFHKGELVVFLCNYTKANKWYVSVIPTKKERLELTINKVAIL